MAGIKKNQTTEQKLFWNGYLFLTYNSLSLDELPHDKTNKMTCAPSKDSAQPQSLHFAFNGKVRTQGFFVRTAKTLIRLGGCPGWSESSWVHMSYCCFFMSRLNYWLGGRGLAFRRQVSVAFYNWQWFFSVCVYVYVRVVYVHVVFCCRAIYVLFVFLHSMPPGAVARSEASSLGMQVAPSSIPTSGTFFRGDLVMKTFLRPFSLYRWFKKSSCQVLTKECALSTGKLPRRLAQEQCG